MSNTIKISTENVDMLVIDLKRYRETWAETDGNTTSHIHQEGIKNKTVTAAQQCAEKTKKIKDAMQELLNQTVTFYETASAAYKKADNT